MIRGFPRQRSPVAGGEVVLHVATDAPEFRVELWRCGADLVLQAGSGWLPGRPAPAHMPHQDWSVANTDPWGRSLEPWAAYRLPAPEEPGVYVAVLVEGDGAGRDTTHPDRSTPDGRDAKVLFVVRPPAPRPGALLAKLPLLTYHAYDVVHGDLFGPTNDDGTWCLYSLPRPGRLPVDPPPSVNLHRPGGGTGGVPYDLWNTDPFDATPRQTFAHWDWRLVRWLERAGYAVDWCTDVDLHRLGADLLRPYPLLVSAGHDEYWSDAMRSAVEEWVDAGGNLAFFSGNTMWWRVAFDDTGLAFARLHQWSDPARSTDPENTVLGASFRHGGERDRDDHPVPVGFRVQHADSWVYAGTGLADGDVFGGGPDEYVVGYECDGAAFDRADLEAGRVVGPSGEDGTPRDALILGVGDLRPSGWGSGNAAATMVLLQHRRGTVFNAATTDWVRLLDRPGPVERITRNVLDRLGGVPLAGTFPAPGS
ncbi:MAG: hypothetical protein M3P95_00935 [Actinomycetota bacterium]|nr:hypothetical protein [Actinomycetota bacterium]